jgi:hypothetical protein
MASTSCTGTRVRYAEYQASADGSRGIRVADLPPPKAGHREFDGRELPRKQPLVDRQPLDQEPAMMAPGPFRAFSQGPTMIHQLIEHLQ